MVATTITVDKSINKLPVINQPPSVVESLNDIKEKTRADKEWTQSKIILKDLHQHYLKLSKSRLTSKMIFYVKLCCVIHCVLYLY